MLITQSPSIFSLCFQDCMLLIFVNIPTIGPNNFYFRTLNKKRKKRFFCLVCTAVALQLINLKLKLLTGTTYLILNSW